MKFIPTFSFPPLELTDNTVDAYSILDTIDQEKNVFEKLLKY